LQIAEHGVAHAAASLASLSESEAVGIDAYGATATPQDEQVVQFKYLIIDARQAK
jgi:hypothetical protein